MDERRESRVSRIDNQADLGHRLEPFAKSRPRLNSSSSEPRVYECSRTNDATARVYTYMYMDMHGKASTMRHASVF